MDEETRSRLSDQLIRLGDMIGDGLHHEPDGGWITKEYRRVARALGHKMPSKPRRNNSAQINERMAERVKECRCGKCSGKLKQKRAGSVKAACVDCKAVYTLLKITKVKA